MAGRCAAPVSARAPPSFLLPLSVLSRGGAAVACDAASAASVWPPWLRWLWQLPPWRRPALGPRLRTLATVAAAAGWAPRRPRGQACPSLTAPSVWPGAAQRAGGPPAARQARRRRRGRRVRGLRRAEQPRAIPLTPRPAPRDSAPRVATALGGSRTRRGTRLLARDTPCARRHRTRVESGRRGENGFHNAKI